MDYRNSYRVLTTIIKDHFSTLPKEISARVPWMKLSSQSWVSLKALAVLARPASVDLRHAGAFLKDRGSRVMSTGGQRCLIWALGCNMRDCYTLRRSPLPLSWSAAALPLWRTQSLSGSWLISCRKWSGCNFFVFCLITFGTAIYPSPLAGPIATIY